MLITVAICTRDRMVSLARCLEALSGQTVPAEQFEILVVDNAPGFDASRQRAAGFADIANLRWVHAAEPGVARARNVAIAQARAPLLAFIDDDVLASPGWLAALLDGFGRFGEAVHSLGGPVRPRWSAPRPHWLADPLLPYLALIDRGDRLRLLAPQEWVAGANSAYRTQAVRAVGGFNPWLGRLGDILLSNEETELAGRLRAAGGSIGWVPGAAVEHCIVVERLTQPWFRRRIAWQAVSDFLQKPEHAHGQRGVNWAEAEGFFERTRGSNALHALAAAQSDPGRFLPEIAAIYHLVLSLLNGLESGGPG